MMETSKKPTLSGNETVLMVGNIDEETFPQSQQPENSSTQDGSSEEISVYNPQEQKRVLHYYSRLARSFHFPCLAASTYLPAPNPLVKDLNATASTINTPITVYIVVRGIAPTFIGSISDKNGRWPTFMICYVIYLGANIGLVAEQLLGVASTSLLARFWSLPQLYCHGQ
jgi:hypothetical protein